MEIVDPQAQNLGKDFFDREDMYEFYKFCASRIKKETIKTFEEIHQGIGKDWIELLEGCLTLSPSKRMDYDKLINLPLFDSIRDKALEASAKASVELDLTADKLIFNEQGQEVEIKIKKHQSYIQKLIKKVHQSSSLR